jgi:glycosyltransferase involved in cell wall biosynthesis
MKLAILHPFQFRYARGIERFTWSLASALAARGDQIDLLTWRWPQPIRWGSEVRGVRTRQVPDLRYFRERVAVPFYATWLLRGGYDHALLYFGGYGEAEALRLVRAVRNVPYSVVLHFPREQVPHRYEELKRLGLAAHAAHLIAVSDFVARGAEPFFQRPCVVIENGVDVEQFAPSAERRTAARAQLGLNDDAPVLVTLAALEERKGVQWVLRALPTVLARFPNARYYVLGEGAYRGALEAEIAALGLGAHAQLVGSVSDVLPYLAAADVGCLLSYGEAFGITLLEYMAMALPVLTSKHPPFDDLVHADWGVAVDEQDTPGVAAQIIALLEDSALRARLGAAGRQRAAERYAWPQVAARYSQLVQNR